MEPSADMFITDILITAQREEEPHTSFPKDDGRSVVFYALHGLKGAAQKDNFKR